MPSAPFGPGSIGFANPSSATAQLIVIGGTAAADSTPFGFHFEYGTTEQLGQVQPVPDAEWPHKDVDVQCVLTWVITGLQAGTTYYWRAVATGPFGTATSGIYPFETLAHQTGDSAVTLIRQAGGGANYNNPTGPGDIPRARLSRRSRLTRLPIQAAVRNSPTQAPPSAFHLTERPAFPASTV